jgi:NarL family two-component system response regulator LiaR
MGASEPIRVLIVDDHAMVRSGLRLFLMGFDDMTHVGEAASGEEAVRDAEDLQPDVVLMDMVMPGMGGAEATRRIVASRPETRVITLTSFYEKDMVEEAFRAGATSYLLKNVTAEALAEAIRAAHVGKPTLAPEAAEALIKTTRTTPGIGSDLTLREREVLSLMKDGLTNPAIAKRLSISESTVKFHVSSILGKLGARNRVDAVRLATENGLGSRPSSE